MYMLICWVVLRDQHQQYMGYSTFISNERALLLHRDHVSHHMYPQHRMVPYAVHTCTQTGIAVQYSTTLVACLSGGYVV